MSGQALAGRPLGRAVLFRSAGADGMAPRVAPGRRPRGIAFHLVRIGVVALPVLVPPGPANTAPVDLVLLAAVTLTVAWAVVDRIPLRFPYAASIGLFAAAGAVAALAGPLPLEGGIAVLQDLYLLAWCLALVNVVRAPDALRSILRAWAITGLVWACGLVIAVLSNSGLAGIAPESTRAAFTYGEQNGAALYLVISLMVMLATKQPAGALARAVSVVVVATAVLMTGSLAGLLGLTVALGIGTVLILWERSGPIAAVAASVALVLVGVIAALPLRAIVLDAKTSQYALIRNSLGREQQSSSERAELASEQAGLYAAAGLLGKGPGSTAFLLSARQAPYPKTAHDDFAAALLERGVLGELALLMFLGGVAVRASAIRARRNLAPAFRAVVPAPAFLVAALGTILVYMVTHQSMHDRTVWTLFAVVAALHVWGRRSRPPRLAGRRG